MLSTPLRVLWGGGSRGGFRNPQGTGILYNVTLSNIVDFASGWLNETSKGKCMEIEPAAARSATGLTLVVVGMDCPRGRVYVLQLTRKSSLKESCYLTPCMSFASLLAVILHLGSARTISKAFCKCAVKLSSPWGLCCFSSFQSHKQVGVSGRHLTQSLGVHSISRRTPPMRERRKITNHVSHFPTAEVIPVRRDAQSASLSCYFSIGPVSAF
jgi:hypothetical protein